MGRTGDDASKRNSCSTSAAPTPISRIRSSRTSKSAPARNSLHAGAARRHLQGDRQPVADAGLRPHQEQAGLRAAGDAALHPPPRHHGVQVQSVLPGQHAAAHALAVAAQNEGILPRYMSTPCSITCGTRPRRWTIRRSFSAALAESGLDRDALLERAQTPRSRQRLIANTEDAVARGTFGIPTFFVGRRDLLRQGPAARCRGGD